MSRTYRKWKEIIKECRRNNLSYMWGGLIIDGSFGSSLADYRRLRRRRHVYLRWHKSMEREKEKFFQDFRRQNQILEEYIFEEH